MTQRLRAPIDPNHHKGIVAADSITGEAFAIQGDSQTGAGYFTELGAGLMTHAQITVADTETVIVASRTGRKGVIITNLGTTDVWLGNTGVTTANGTLLLGTKGSAMFIPTTAAIYGIVGSGTQAVSYLEVYS